MLRIVSIAVRMVWNIWSLLRRVDVAFRSFGAAATTAAATTAAVVSLFPFPDIINQNHIILHMEKNTHDILEYTTKLLRPVYLRYLFAFT